MSAKFYAEDLQCSDKDALRVSEFMSIAKSSLAILSPKPWAKNGIIRVYFDLWSQNNLPAVIRCSGKNFYDAKENEIFFIEFCYGIDIKHTLSAVTKFGKSNFSGAKTRQAINQFSEVFYAKKESWC